MHRPHPVTTLYLASVTVACVLAPAASVQAQIEEAERIVIAREVLGEIMDAADSAIPSAVLDGAASTDILLSAEILSYSRTRGLFPGVSLKGASIRADRDANERFYGEKLETSDIVIGGLAGTAHDADVVAALQAALARHAP